MKDFFISRGRWYYTLTIFSGGVLSWIAFLHASGRVDAATREAARSRAKTYGGVGLALFVIYSATPTSTAAAPTDGIAGTVESLVTVLLLGVVCTACVQLRPLQQLAHPRRGLAPPAPTADDRAVAQVMYARQRRVAARRLAEDDPALARELGIGGPRGGTYDDGGLIDLNTAPVEAIVLALGVSRESAETIVSTRDAWGTGFSSIDEVLAHVTLTPHQTQVVRDRGITLPV